MSVVLRLFSSGAARGVAALLALLLSAIIGGRVGVDRLSWELADDEECAAVDCLLVAEASGDAAPIAWVAAADPIVRPGRYQPDAILPRVSDHQPVPGLLRGSAGGPRAP